MPEHVEAAALDRLDRLQGHLWTLGPAIERMCFGAAPRDFTRWEAEIRDERERPLVITGELHRASQSRSLVILIHGLGGSSRSHYLLDALPHVLSRGHSVLRLSMRGVDSPSADIYHAGLTHDLHAILAHPALSEWAQIMVIGYSLGGHVTLRASAEPLDARVRAMCAICAPVDLPATIHHIDAPAATIYREYVLRGLRAQHDELVRRGAGIAPKFKIDAVHRLRTFDALVIAPRYGFSSPEHYYQTQSASAVLSRIDRPLLYIGTVADPMIPQRAALPHLARAPRELVEVRWLERGGHVYFPPGQDLGFGGERGVVAQAMSWMERQL